MSTRPHPKDHDESYEHSCFRALLPMHRAFKHDIIEASSTTARHPASRIFPGFASRRPTRNPINETPRSAGARWESSRANVAPLSSHKRERRGAETKGRTARMMRSVDISNRAESPTASAAPQNMISLTDPPHLSTPTPSSCRPSGVPPRGPRARDTVVAVMPTCRSASRWVTSRRPVSQRQRIGRARRLRRNKSAGIAVDTATRINDTPRVRHRYSGP